jgi:hypothetical protein
MRNDSRIERWGGRMKGSGLGLLFACLLASQSAGAESAADAIAGFGLVGVWSMDCSRDPIATCNPAQGCGGRTIYEVPSSGPPIIKNIVGSLVPGVGKNFETIIESASRLSDDTLKIISVMQGVPGVISKAVWMRQPGERWESILVKIGNDKYRVVSAHSEDGKKISAGDGFMYLPPPDTRIDRMPSRWVRSERVVPTFERCLDRISRYSRSSAIAWTWRP